MRDVVIPVSDVIFERDGKILLLRRFETGYSDGFYALPAGHIDKGETPLDAALRERIMNIVKQTKGNQVELVEKVDKELIGGFILRVGDEQIDTSISKELRNLKNEFDDNLYVKEF